MNDRFSRSERSSKKVVGRVKLNIIPHENRSLMAPVFMLVPYRFDRIAVE